MPGSLRMRQTTPTSRCVLVLAALMVALFAIQAVAASQDVSPAATPDVPQASECTVDPVDLASLLPLLSGGGEPSDLLTATPTPEEALPEGPAAIDEEIDAVTETVRLLVACANLGDPLRILALLSDDFKASLAATVINATEADAEAFLMRFPVPLFGVEPDEEVRMISIRDGRLLPNGNVGFILEPTVPGVDELRPVFFVEFTETRTGWLIHDVIIVTFDADVPTSAGSITT